MLLEGSRYCINEAKKKGIKCIFQDLEKRWKLNSEMFDFVVLADVLEHLFNYDFVIKEAKRVLKKGGTIIITTPNLASLRNRIKLFMGKQLDWLDEGSKGHIRLFTCSYLRSLLKKENFRKISFYPTFINVFGKKIKVNKLFVGLGEGIIVVAEKHY